MVAAAYSPPSRTGSTRAWKRYGPLVVVSVFFHLLVGLSLIVLKPTLVPYEARALPDQLIDLELIPVTLPTDMIPRERIVAAQPQNSAVPLGHTSTARSSEAASDAPGTPSPRVAAPAPAGTSGTRQGAEGDSRWTYQEESIGSRVARSLRTSPIGCDYPERLSEGERQICAERSTDRAVRKLEEGQRIEGTGNARRDRAFEAQGRARLRAYESRRAPQPSGVGVVGPEDGVGSNFGIGVAGRHLDPSMQPDATGPIQTTRREGRPAERERIERARTPF